MNIRLVYITTSDEEEAARIGRQVVADRLAACANIVKSIRSFYWWEGELQEDTEAILILKTKAELMERLIEKVREMHSYQCPCVVSLPILEGNPLFLNWIRDETLDQ